MGITNSDEEEKLNMEARRALTSRVAQAGRELGLNDRDMAEVALNVFVSICTASQQPLENMLGWMTECHERAEGLLEEREKEVRNAAN